MRCRFISVWLISRSVIQFISKTLILQTQKPQLPPTLAPLSLASISAVNGRPIQGTLEEIRKSCTRCSFLCLRGLHHRPLHRHQEQRRCRIHPREMAPPRRLPRGKLASSAYPKLRTFRIPRRRRVRDGRSSKWSWETVSHEWGTKEEESDGRARRIDRWSTRAGSAL